MQGSAADILKKATMSVLENLRKKSLLKKTDLILTVHDELLFECDENLAKMVGRETKKVMEDVGKHFQLKVPLFADLRIGKTWADLSKRKNNT
jgi:DNA polymerase I-like protein with 3'-5' exonuclease and polymerase domains